MGERSPLTSKIGRAYQYWFRAIIRPEEVFDAFKRDSDKLEVSLWLIFFFALFYSVTALLFYFLPILPAIEPWIPIAKEEYYLYQAFWTVPWGFATALMLASIAHVMAVFRRDDTSSYTFENALAVIAIAWVVPSFVFMWIPETLIVPFFGGTPWPAWAEVLRLAILAPIWQVALAIIGMRKTHNVSWGRGIAIGLAFVGVSFAMFLPIMR
jgi:hypothetical protein